MNGVRLAAAMAAAALAAGCGSVPAKSAGSAGAPPATPRFADVTAEAGITFRYTFGDFSYDNILESSGSGVAVFDYDGDGRMDVLFLDGRYLAGISDPKGKVFANARAALYRNNGDGTFTDVTEKAGFGGSRWAMAATVADLDGDGLPDVYLSNYGPNTFLHNNGDGTYTDRTAESGLAGPETLNGFTKWSVGAVPFDADGDGQMELYVANFLAFDPDYLSPGSPERMPAPAEYRGQASLLYRRGADGRWREVTKEAGLFRPESRAMGAAAFDCDGDGKLDLFQANDHQPNFLFRNLGKTFEEVAAEAGVAVNLDGVGTGHMHPTVGDVDGDGKLDVLITDLSYQSLYRATGPCRFEDVTATSGIKALMNGAESWGGGLADLDDDGDLDLFATNGGADTLVEKRPTLLVNDGKGHFTDAADSAGPYFLGKRSGRGAAFGDFDDDGRIDIVVNHVDLKGTPVLLRNVTPRSGNHWLGVALKPAAGASEPTGALVFVTAGGKTQVRVYGRGRSYLSQDDPRLHFGLGKAGRAERLEVRWPSGRVQKVEDPPVDRYLTVTEPQAGSTTTAVP